MKNRATLKDIAKALNVSITTVSRALNNKTDISIETRQKVLEVAKMLDYEPNTMAISLRKSVARQIIGVILPSIEHHFFSTILKGITTSAHNSGFMIMFCESNYSSEKEVQLMNQLKHHFVSGIIYAPSKNASREQNLHHLDNLNIPYVLIDRIFADYNGSYVQYDDYNGAYDATEHLISQGYRRITHITGNLDCSVSSERKRGYLDAMSQYRLKSVCIEAKSNEDISDSYGYSSVMKITSSGDAFPDAIFTVTDSVAVGVYEGLAEHNKQVPHDVAIMGFSNSRISKHLVPKLSTVEQNGNSMGDTAFKFLLDKIENRNLVLQKTFSPKLIIRDSTPRIG